MITNNPYLIKTNASELLFNENHVLFWKKRGATIWKELHYDDPSLASIFPAMSIQNIHSLTGGPYQLRKAKSYVKDWLEYMMERKRTRSNRSQSQSQTATNTTLNSKLTLKMERLEDIYLHENFPQFHSCIRCDIPSFYSRWRKYKILILVQKHNNSARFSFACTCNTGNRSSPCAHGVLIVYLYAFHFKRLD